MSTRGLTRVGTVRSSELYPIDRLATVAEAMTLTWQHDVDALTVNWHDETD